MKSAAQQCAKAVTKEALPPDVFVPHLLACAAPPSCSDRTGFFCTVLQCTVLYHCSLVHYSVSWHSGDLCSTLSGKLLCTLLLSGALVHWLCSICAVQEYIALHFMALWYTVLYIRGALVHCAVQEYTVHSTVNERDPGALCRSVEQFTLLLQWKIRAWSTCT